MSRSSRGAPEVVVATGNLGKLSEIRAILADAPIALRSLADFPGVTMPEEGDDYAANAIAKARAVAHGTGRVSIADDSGIEVDALDGRPGPGSARYGGPGLDDEQRTSRLLHELAASGDAARSARFICVAAMVTPSGDVETARGECPGTILTEPRGAAGFGYDPVFEPAGERSSMAELSAARKNEISHRGRAFRALRDALERATTARVTTSFLLVRHAESEWNAERRWQGHADPPLSARGFAQAKALAGALERDADLLVSSDLCRTRQTAEIVGAALGLAPRLDPRLRELDVGTWSGLTREEIAVRDPAALQRFDAGDEHALAGGAESRAQLRLRVCEAFNALAREWPGARVVVVTHLGVVRALTGGDLALAATRDWTMPPPSEDPPRR